MTAGFTCRANPDEGSEMSPSVNVPILKRRTLFIAERGASASLQRMRQIKGVHNLTEQPGALTVEYDLSQTSLAKIEALAAAEGIRFNTGLHWLRRSLWKFTERNELENALHPGSGACCSRPPARNSDRQGRSP